MAGVKAESDRLCRCSIITTAKDSAVHNFFTLVMHEFYWGDLDCKVDTGRMVSIKATGDHWAGFYDQSRTIPNVWYK